MAGHQASESFAKKEWVEFHGPEGIRKFQVTAVNGNEVTVRVFGKPTVFAPRRSDGKFVKVGSADREATPSMIVKLPDSRWTWKDIFDFLHGAFWGFNVH